MADDEEPRPDYARGQDEETDEERKERPDFARGQDEGRPEHTGTFAEGEEREPHEPKEAQEGDFAEGQRTKDDRD